MAANIQTVDSEVDQKDTTMKHFGSFKVRLADFLTFTTVIRLATLFQYPMSLLDQLERKENSSHAMIHFMEERGQIKSTDITPLLKGLKQLDLIGIESSVRELFEDCTGIPCSVIDSSKEHKKGIFVNSLRKMYSLWYSKIQPIPYIRDKIYCVYDVYVEVGIVKVAESFKNCQKSLESRGSEEISSFSDVFDNNKLRTNRILLEGDPGYGKSTFTLQAAYEWCSGRRPSPLKLFEIFILLPLRLLRNISSIFEAIRLVLMPAETNLEDGDIKEILISCSQGVIVLDGYDEYPSRDNKCESDVMKIIKGTMFANFKVILTTRSSSLPRDLDPSTVTIKLTGFSDISVYEYVKRAVTGGNENEAKKIKDILNSTPVLADICQVPIFCVLFAHITHEQEHSIARFSSVTSFFRYILSCFYSHMKKKQANDDKGAFIPHYKELNKLAFDSLVGKDQQIRWPKESFIKTVGIECFKELSGIGILIEEQVLEVKDEPGVDVSEHIRYREFVRFYHKLFVEWYAGIYLSSYAGGFWPIWLSYTLDMVNPVDLQYVFRFASGLNDKACDRIVRYLQGLDGGKIFASLCFFEQSSDQAKLSSMVRSLCSGGMTIRSTDSKLLQRSNVQILDIASRNKIPVSCLVLDKSAEGFENEKLTLNTGFLLPPLKSVQKLEVKTERGEEYTVQKFLKFLSYCQQCGSYSSIYFIDCLLPVCMESFVSVMESFKWKVFWRPFNDDFRLDSLTGKWKLQQSSTTDIQDNQLSTALCREILSMFHGELTFLDDDSKERRDIITSVLQTAVKHTIPISSLVVDKSLLSDDRRGINIKSGCRLPKSLEMLEVRGKNRTELAQNTMLRIICNLKECPNLKKLTFSGCLLPISFLDEKIFSTVQAMGLQVIWRELDKEFRLNPSSGGWILTDSGDILGLALKDHHNLKSMCQATSHLRKTDSKELQKSKLLLLEIASSYGIPISELNLEWSFRGFDGDNIRLESGLCISSLSSVEKLSINGDGNQQISEEEVIGLLNFGMKSTRFTELWFFNCKLPPSINPASLTEAMERNVNVLSSEEAKYLVMENGIWEKPEDIETIKSMCSYALTISDRTSESVQRSVIEFLVKASNKDIPIFWVFLAWSFDKIDEDGLDIILKSGLLLPNISSMERMTIQTEKGREMKEEEVNGILNYLQQNKRLKRLDFRDCVLPSPISLGPYASTLRSRNVKVIWTPDAEKTEQYYRLNLGSAHFKTKVL